MKAVSLLLTTLASADNNFGNTPKPGLCPEGIPDQPNFDRERYVGQWYNYLANDLVQKKNRPAISLNLYEENHFFVGDRFHSKLAVNRQPGYRQEDS